jgi:hypothetical protein
VRKLHRNMLNAIQKKVAWTGGGIEVRIDPEVISVYFKGRPVAEKYHEKWMAHNCNWRQERTAEVAWILTALGFIYVKAEKSWWLKDTLG